MAATIGGSMPRKVPTLYCSYEADVFPRSEFETVGGSLIHHCGQPDQHRPDGLEVTIEDGVVTVAASSSMAAAADAVHRDMA